MKRVGTWQACALAALVGLASSAGFAQGATDCSSVADDKDRLQCYDEQASRQKKPAVAPAPSASASGAVESQAAAPAHASVPRPAPASAASAPAPSDFGLDPDVVRRKREAEHPDVPRAPEQIVLHVKSVTTRPHGEYRITMDNGQVWDQTVRNGFEDPPREGEAVTIARGVMGSYFLNRKGGSALRVKRIL